jgi:pimeloyl-ACP methyl ester carboxylesterase
VIAATLFAAALLAPCRIDTIDARCGTISGLNVVVVPAAGTRKRDALFILQGGPGQAATALTRFYAETFQGIGRDIVLVDQRGTGKSNGLYCALPIDGDLFPLREVEQCRDEFARRMDLRELTTAAAVRDLERVRHALGYSKVDLYGTSYGTRVALEYTRRHRERVRAVIVKGVVAPSLRYTVDPALDTQRSLEKVMARVPSLRGDLAIAFAHLPPNFTREALGVEVRNLLHSITDAEELPALIHRAAQGDWAPLLASSAKHRAALTKGVALGMYFSITCAEDAWRVGAAAAARETAGTLAGDYWHRQLTRVCAIWPHAEPQRGIAEPFRSRVPALIVSGAFDPVTPPRFGEELTKIFYNSRHVVVPNASHSFARMAGCVDVMMRKFVEEPEPGRVDASCVAGIPAPKF